MLARVDLKIEESVIIPCPKIEFRSGIAANICPGCDYYDGLGVMTSDMSFPWYKRYAVRCTHPIERRVQPSILREGL